MSTREELLAAARKKRLVEMAKAKRQEQITPEFNADQFVDRDIKISLEIEKLNLVLGVAKKRYDLLFK